MKTVILVKTFTPSEEEWVDALLFQLSEKDIIAMQQARAILQQEGCAFEAIQIRLDSLQYYALGTHRSDDFAAGFAPFTPVQQAQWKAREDSITYAILPFFLPSEDEFVCDLELSVSTPKIRVEANEFRLEFEDANEFEVVTMRMPFSILEESDEN